MKLSKAFGSLFLLASLSFVSPVLAGGQLVDLNADSYGATNSDGTYGRIMRFVWRGAPCEGTEVTFKFVDPKDGDYVMTTSGNATFVFTKDRQPYYKNGEQVCGTNAKMGSKVLGERNVTVVVTDSNSVVIGANPPVIKVDFDGQYHSDNSYNGYNYRSSQDDPYYALIQSQQTSNPTPPPANINAYLLGQQFMGQNRREVTVKWSAFGGYSGTFTIYAKAATNKNDWEEKFDGSKGPSTTFSLRADQDYHLKVNGCMDKWGTCVDSNILLLPKLQNQDGKVVIPKNPNPTISPSPTVDNNQVDELNKKVENLQNQLDQSKKTQSVLEQRISDLVNFIKRLFPFFK